MEMLDRDEQAQACRHLLAAVITTAIRDGCATPPRESKGQKRKISSEAFTAMRFLFDERVSGLNEYLMWFDIDTGQYRVRLLKAMFDDGALRVNGFDPLDRRNFRVNYNVWQRLKDVLHVDDSEDSEGENDD